MTVKHHPPFPPGVSWMPLVVKAQLSDHWPKLRHSPVFQCCSCLKTHESLRVRYTTNMTSPTLKSWLDCRGGSSLGQSCSEDTSSCLEGSGSSRSPGSVGTVDGWLKSGKHSPVEVKVVCLSHYSTGFLHHPNCGWPNCISWNTPLTQDSSAPKFVDDITFDFRRPNRAAAWNLCALIPAINLGFSLTRSTKVPGCFCSLPTKRSCLVMFRIHSFGLR